MLSNVKIIQCGGRPVRQITRLNVCFYRRFFVSKENNYLVVPFVVPIGQRLESNITTNILILQI